MDPFPNVAQGLAQHTLQVELTPCRNHPGPGIIDAEAQGLQLPPSLLVQLKASQVLSGQDHRTANFTLKSEVASKRKGTNVTGVLNSGCPGRL